MSTQPISPNSTISQFLLTLRKPPRKAYVRRMCDNCLINLCERCDDPKCPCACRDADCNFAA